MSSFERLDPIASRPCRQLVLTDDPITNQEYPAAKPPASSPPRQFIDVRRVLPMTLIRCSHCSRRGFLKAFGTRVRGPDCLDSRSASGRRRTRTAISKCHTHGQVVASSESSDRSTPRKCRATLVTAQPDHDWGALGDCSAAATSQSWVSNFGSVHDPLADDQCTICLIYARLKWFRSSRLNASCLHPMDQAEEF